MGALSNRYLNSGSTRAKAASNGAGDKATKKSLRNGGDNSELESDASDDEGNAEAPAGHALKGVEELTAEERAKRAVLDSSSSSENSDNDPDPAKQQRKKEKKEERKVDGKVKGEKKSAKSGTADPKFMRMRLDSSDEEDTEKKAERRQDKIKAELEAKRKKRRVSSSGNQENVFSVFSTRYVLL